MPVLDNDYFKTIVDNMFSAVICFDMQKRVLFANPSFFKITGYKTKELDFDFWRFVDLKYKQKIVDIWSESFKGNTSRLPEFQIVDKNGNQKWLGFHCHAIYDDDKAQIGVYVRLVNISDQKKIELSYLKSEEKLKESESRLHALFNSTVETFILLDKNYRIETFNSKASDYATALFGKPLSRGSEIFEYIFPQDKELLIEQFQKAISGEYVSAEYKMVFPEASVWLEMSYFPVYEDGNVTSVCLTTIDITQRKESNEKLRESESNLQAIFNSSIQSFILLDKNCRIQVFNLIADEYFKKLSQKNLSKNALIFDFIPETVLSDFRDRVENALNGTYHSLEYMIEVGNKEIEWLEMSFLPVHEENQIKGACLSILNVTARKMAEREIQESKHFIQQIADSSPNFIYLIDIETTKFIYLNRSWENILGFNIDQVYKTNSIEFFIENTHPQDVDKKQKSGGFIDENGNERAIDAEFRFKDNYGNYRWLYTTEVIFLKNKNGRIKQILGTAQDITNRKELEAKLTREAMFDTLTGLPNRRYFLEELQKDIEKQKEDPNYLFAVLFIDLDRFKLVNDSLGHSIGDKLLVAVSKRLKYVIRTVDFVARLGGDEFIVLVKDIKTIKEVSKITEIIQKSISQVFILDRFNISTTSSIGIAPANKSYNEAEEILRDADTAMYKAKSTDRNSFSVFNQAMHTQALQTLQIEAELDKAIKTNELQLYYQPVQYLETGRICSCEALVRWNHPKRGLLSPVDFLDIAQETGQIVSIDKWVLDTACRQLAIWKKLGIVDLKMAVNLSLKQLKQERLLYWIKKAINRYGINASLLEFELTENSLIDNSIQTIETLNRIRELGIILCLDDFGTGYSSLRYLKNLPLDIIKIDQSFVKDIPRSVETSAIVKSIIDLSHDLNLSVVAEGVQNEEQLNFLKEAKCDTIQGYFVSKPLSSDDFIKFLLKQ